MDLPAGLSLIGVRCGKLCQDLIADLPDVLVISVDDNICSGLVSVAPFFHEITDEVDILVIFEQRPAVVIFQARQNSFRLGAEKDDAAVFLHLGDVSLAHRDASAAGDDDVLSGLHLNEERGLAAAEVLLAACLEDFADTHTFSLGDDPVHLDHFHAERGVKIGRNGRFSGAHKADQDQVEIKRFMILGQEIGSCHLLYPFKSLIYREYDTSIRIKVQPKVLNKVHNNKKRC